MAAKKKDFDEKQVKDWIEKGVEKLDCDGKKNKNVGSAGGWFWFTGFLGALIYFWQYVDSITTGVIAVVKACVWPGFLVYHFMKFLRI